MPSIEQLLNLSQIIAKKSRSLISRSANRIIFGDPAPDDTALDSQWDLKHLAPRFMQLRLLAMRATKTTESAKGARDRLLGLCKESGVSLVMRTQAEERLDQGLFKEWAEIAGVDLKDLAHVLRDNSRANKWTHKDGQQFTFQERDEASAKNAIRHGVGNCPECAALAMQMFADYKGPGGDDRLPALSQPPVAVERICASGDHSFVVVNRNQSTDISNTGRWMTPDVVICDPWWFHAGDAILATDHDTDGKSLIDFIQKDPKLRVRLKINLGQGHTTRFNQKHPGLDYYLDPVEDIKRKVGQV